MTRRDRGVVTACAVTPALDGTIVDVGGVVVVAAAAYEVGGGGRGYFVGGREIWGPW